MTKKWWQGSVVYQVYPRSYQDSNGDGIGDLPGLTQRLPYIKKLGADVIWLNPIYKSPDKDNGYDISDYRSIQPAYGTMDDFDTMLESAHKQGLKILMDLVVNHTSDKHEWFEQSRQSKDNPYSDYYIWRDPVDGHAPNNWGSYFSGPAWTYEPKRGQYYLHLFAPGQPDLNWENPKVRQEVYSLMKFWLDKGVNGFRMDVINLISKPAGLPDAPQAPGAPYGNVEPLVSDGPRLNEFLHEMNLEVLSKYDIMTVGEMPGSTPEDAIEYTGLKSNELNMVFQFEHVGLAANPDKKLGKWNDQPIQLVDLKKALSRWQVELDGKGWNSLYWNNHDQPRAVSRFATDDPKYRVKAAKMLGTTLHMMQGTPYVYEGEELGETNVHYQKLDQYEDIESINAYHQLVEKDQAVDGPTMLKYMENMSRDNARTPMQWDDSDNAGFTTGKPWFALNPNYNEINAKSQVDDPNSVFNYYRQLIDLRHNSDLITLGTYEEIDPDDNEVFAYRRHYQGQTLLVISNFTDQTVQRDYGQANAKRLIGNYEDSQNDTLRPYETNVYLLND
ncbi:glycoside hydrolase family 13 protein [Companilactobacillus sp.]|jgi:oligo-1,6-glucosidase|uniref:glycoside hydrolase family 13 protein n=1 Tax=Companilactobacillus sp. TaxID=2767905 RepID=UPI0025C23D88|nr:alpha-glucosidase [Companilactobacillus sp.]MCH4009157.1 alpha-glucosidase [Companilactobacillus sp.]MCH4050664.1 alpha-glucosidase [Companilactobacillus sp.]MCH4077099.1 alpha-glucosidase [Companilactobacillus sp.]MCH4125675.1 alpha-glucosidase [Companilactobacillus sp.]MCI1311384.1 alpha-glucosidase [Companilactobacillus sp.]